MRTEENGHVTSRRTSYDITFLQSSIMLNVDGHVGIISLISVVRGFPWCATS